MKKIYVVAYDNSGSIITYVSCEKRHNDRHDMLQKLMRTIVNNLKQKNVNILDFNIKTVLLNKRPEGYENFL